MKECKNKVVMSIDICREVDMKTRMMSLMKVALQILCRGQIG